jgi:hypothetical protein
MTDKPKTSPIVMVFAILIGIAIVSFFVRTCFGPPI